MEVSCCCCFVFPSFHSGQVIVECMRRGVVSAPTAVASGQYHGNLMEGTTDDGLADEVYAEVWEDKDEDAEESLLATV